MKTRELREMMDADSKMDMSRLDEESLRTPMLHGKYYGILMDEIKILRGAEQEEARLKRRMFEYYTGKADDEIYMEKPMHLRVNKGDLDVYFNSDEEYQDLQRKLIIQKQRVDMLQEFIKSVINARGFQIKDAIAFLQFKTGVK